MKENRTQLMVNRIIISLLIVSLLPSCINKAKENLSQFVCTLSADNNPKRYIQITFKDSFMYMYSHELLVQQKQTANEVEFREPERTR